MIYATHSSIDLTTQSFREDNVDSQLNQANLTSVTLYDSINTKLVTIWLKCPTFELLNQSIYNPHIKVIKDTIPNTIRQNFFKRLLGMNIGECRKTYTIMFHNKIIAKIIYNIQENTHKVSASNEYRWEMNNVLKSEPIIPLTRENLEILETFGMKN